MRYSDKLIHAPLKLFERRIELMGQRIQTLVRDYDVAKHYITQAIILEELDNLVDDYVERSFVLQRQKNEQSGKTSQD